MHIRGYLKAHPIVGVRLDPTDFFEVEDSTFTPQQSSHLQLEYEVRHEELNLKDPKPLERSMTLPVFTYADRAHNKIDRRSTTGRVIVLGSGILSRKSKRQVGCEGSSYGSELRAKAATATALIGYRIFFRGVRIPVKELSLPFVDNNAAPRVGHARRVMRIWGYLKAHPNMGVRLDPTDFFDLEDDDSTFTPEQREHLKIEYGDLEEECDPNDPRPLGKALTLTGMADADHAHNQVDRRSTNGRIIFLGRGILAWKSKRQVGCEGSSYGSELRAMASSARELRGYRMFLRGIGIPVKGTSLLFVDNAAALYAASNLATTLKVKHLSIDYHTVRELTAWGVIQPEKVPTAQNLADVLTKPTSCETFWRLITQLMVIPLGKNIKKGAAVLVQMLSCKD